MNTVTTLTRKLSVLVLLVMACVLPASAADFMVDSICYNIIGDNEVEVTQRDSVPYAGVIVIPATVEYEGVTYQVTTIGKYAFMACGELTLIDIAEGITKIDYAAFHGCPRLENIDLPNSLISIGDYAFYSCRAFTVIHIPRNVASIGANTFTSCLNNTAYTCSSLNTHFKAVNGALFTKDMSTLLLYPTAAPASSFTVPDMVAALSDYCFSFNTNLEEVILPESLTWMGMNIFRDCKGITSVYIPDGVRHMGMTVFGGCSNLTSVHLPASLDSIMTCTFMQCDKLTELTIPRNVSYIDETALAFTDNLKTVTIEEGSRLKTIGPRAFLYCYALESINLPNTVESIGASCFCDCHALKSIYVGNNLKEIGNSVFWDCESLVEAEVLGATPNMKNIFINCPVLKRVVLGSKDATPGLTMLANVCIGDCEQIEYLELGSSVDTLANNALVDLNSLKVLICWAPTPPRCNDYWHAFRPTPQSMTAPLYVPKASVEAYRNANEWKLFNTIVAIEDVGDVNVDGAINISDAIDLINILLNDESPLSPALADVNLDGEINISDAMALINRLISER